MIKIPTGEFDTFQECTLHFANDPDVEDPEALCGYIEDRSKGDDISEGDKIIYGLDVQLMSLVDSPAVGDSVWLKSKKLKIKDKNGRQMKCKALHEGSNRGYFLKSELDDENYIVKAVALIPDKVDGNGEALSAREIYKAAIKFMDYQKVDSQHDFIEGKGQVVMNWILDKEQQFELKTGGSVTYPKGTWIVGVKINDPKEWDKIKSGERTGFSIAGYWSAVEVKKLLAKGAQTKDNHDPDSEEEELTKNQELKDLPELTKEEIAEIVSDQLTTFKKELEEEASAKEAESKLEKATSDLESARKEIEELKKALEQKDQSEGMGTQTGNEQKEDENEDEEEEKQEDDEEEDSEESKEEDEEDEEEKTLEEKQLDRAIERRTTKGKTGNGKKKSKEPKPMSVKELIKNYKPSLEAKN